MTSRVLILGACAFSASELAAGIRSKEGIGSAELVFQEEQGFTCYDSNFGPNGVLVNKHGDGCAEYDLSKCRQPEYDTADFRADKMCCLCGGGQARAMDGRCPATCGGYTCDEWVNTGYTCKSLQQEYGCDCHECQLCEKEEEPSKFVFLGNGDCTNEDRSRVDYMNYMWLGKHHCSDKCEHNPECTGFSVSEVVCHIFTNNGLVAAGNEIPEMSDAECWAKHGKAGKAGKKGAKDGKKHVKHPTQPLNAAPLGSNAGAKHQTHDGGFNGEFKPSPNNAPEVIPEESALDDNDDESEDSEASEELERNRAGQNPAVLPVIGLKIPGLAQTYKFMKNHGGHGSSVFNLDSTFYPMESCQDDNVNRCWGETRTPGACEEQPALREQCKKSCGLCDKLNPMNLNSMYVVETSEKSHLDAQRVIFTNEQGALSTYSMFRPQMIASHDTWRIVDTTGDVLFTVQKRKHDVDCKYLFFDCKAVWKIYQGRKRDDLLRFYGIQHEHAFKFYASREDFEKDTVKWLASFKKLFPTEENGHSTFQVTIMPGQDAALMLLAGFAVNNAGDMVKVKKQKKQKK